MRSDRRWLFAMLVFVVICLSVPFWVSREETATAPAAPVAAVTPATPPVAEPPPAVVDIKPEMPKPLPVITKTPPKPRIEPKETYHMVLFASDSGANLARESHVFATFMRQKTDGENHSFEDHTISWMPASLFIAPLRGPEPGKNLTLKETFDWAKSIGSRFAAWGPYEIKKELYDRSKEQFERLKKGEVMYKMLDVRFRPGVAINCIHAVCDCAPADMLLTGTAYGEDAGWMVCNYLRPWIINSSETQDGLLRRIDVQTAGINFRKLEPATVLASP